MNLRVITTSGENMKKLEIQDCKIEQLSFYKFL